MDATPGAPHALLIGDVFRGNASAVPDRAAAALGDEVLSHAALDRAANRTARALRALGVVRGDRVAVWADTGLGQVPLFAAAAKLGAVFAPVNARLGAREAAELLAIARPRLVVTDPERAKDGAALAHAAHAAFAHLGARGADGADLSPGALPAEDSDVDEPALREDDPHVIFFTSGSTGRPKGVVLSHRASWLRSFQGVFHDAPRRSVCMFPMFHMAPWTLALAAWQTRGEIAFVPSPTPEALLAAIARRRANHFYGIPLIWSRLLEADLARHDLRSLRLLETGTSAVPIELVRRLRERFPACTLRIYYGSTEAGSVAALSDADVLRKPGSVGLAPPGGELRLAADGEVLARSPYLMSGYFDDPAASAAALVGDWFHTGRPRRARRRGLPLDRRPQEGRDPERGRERVAGRGGGRARRCAGRGGGGRRRRSRCRVGRGGVRGRGARRRAPLPRWRRSAPTARAASRASSVRAGSSWWRRCRAPRPRARCSVRWSSSAS